MQNCFKSRHVFAIIAVLFAITSGIVSPNRLTITHAQAFTPTYEVVSCPAQLRTPRGYESECGILSVLENRTTLYSNTIQLAVVYVHSRADNPKPDPLIYLSGGPGGSATRLVGAFDRLFGHIAFDRDVILLDQRGTGFSTPSLFCPEYGMANYEAYANNMSVFEGAEHAAAAIIECQRNFEARGIDTTAYHSSENAADIAELRVALGIEEWNLYGISYGTRLALTIMRDHPEGIRSVVIDGVAPPQRSLYVETPINGGGAYTYLFEACAADPECDEAYPNLEQIFYDTVERLSANPVQIDIRRPQDGRAYNAVMDGEFFAGGFFSTLYSSSTIPVLPWVIYEAHAGNYQPLQEYVLSNYFTWDGFATVMHYASNCSDEIAFDTYEALDLSADELPDALQHYFDIDAFVTWEICRDWDMPEPNPIENQSVLSDIPTLLLSGALDPVTPPVWADAAAETLDNHFSFVVPGGGHGVSFSYECAQEMLIAFLDDPSTEPDSSCLADLGDTPEFEILGVSESE